MSLLYEIRATFMWLKDGDLRNIKELPSEYSGIVHKNNTDGVMVGIELDKNTDDVNEKFTSCRFFTEWLGGKKYLLLSCKNETLYTQFASLCCEFLDPGIDGIYRKELENNPYKWWSKWKSLLGNTITEDNVYSIIAEMVVLDHLFQSDKTVVWHSADAGIRDIESDIQTAEVKSTILRNGYQITASSTSQFDTTEPFWLYFCRMATNEKTGISIKDMYDQLLAHGYSKERLDEDLCKQNIDLAEHVCSIKYEIIERMRYLVDKDFPCISDDKFIGGTKPSGIGNISFEIDLESVKIKEKW